MTAITTNDATGTVEIPGYKIDKGTLQALAKFARRGDEYRGMHVVTLGRGAAWATDGHCGIKIDLETTGEPGTVWIPRDDAANAAKAIGRKDTVEITTIGSMGDNSARIRAGAMTMHAANTGPDPVPLDAMAQVLPTPDHRAYCDDNPTDNGDAVIDLAALAACVDALRKANVQHVRISQRDGRMSPVYLDGVTDDGRRANAVVMPRR